MKKFILIFILFLIISFLFLIYYTKQLLSPLSNTPTYNTVVIPPKTSIYEIGKILENNKIVRNSLLFFIYFKLFYKNTLLKAGEYKLSPHQSIDEIINKLIKGESQTIIITIPEGLTLNQVREKFKENNILTHEQFNNAINDLSLLKILPYELDTVEGILFPETYYFTKNTKPLDMIKMMINELNKRLPSDTDECLKKLNHSFKEVLIIASIVEKEAKVDNERPIIASVFYNRLIKNMKLESCATIQYALNTHKLVLLNSDLLIDSPYNTYKFKGLPPTPICSPSIKSLIAALKPQNTDYLFFVAKPDGTHIFSKTYNEHIKAKKIVKTLH